MSEQTLYHEGNEYYAKIKTLKVVKMENWEVFYLDETTGEKWIEEYPNSKLQGGGPAILRKIEKFPWE